MRQKGFTMVEVMVMVSVLGILAAIVIPVVAGHVKKSQREGYETELDAIQKVVQNYFVDKNNPKLLGQPQYPILGAAKASGAPYRGDDNGTPEVIPDGIAGNPLGGTQGGEPLWVDDGNGVRDASEEVLNDEDSPAGNPGWQVAPVVARGVTFFVDTRDFLIDFNLLVAFGLLRDPPRPAAQDNCPRSHCNGSYSYYVDASGTVRTLLASFPTPQSKGWQGVFP